MTSQRGFCNVDRSWRLSSKPKSKTWTRPAPSSIPNYPPDVMPAISQPRKAISLGPHRSGVPMRHQLGKFIAPQVCIVSGSEFLRLIWRSSELWAIMHHDPVSAYVFDEVDTPTASASRFRPIQAPVAQALARHVPPIHSTTACCSVRLCSLSLFSLCCYTLLYHKIHR